MKLPAGTNLLWPEQSFRISEGEVLLLARGEHDFALFRLERSIIFPALPSTSDGGVQLLLSAIGPCRIDLLADQDDQDGRRWLDQRISREPRNRSASVPSSAEVHRRLIHLHHQAQHRLGDQLNAHQPLDANSEARLFRAMESGEEETNAPLDHDRMLVRDLSGEDPLIRCLVLLCPNQAPPRPPRRPDANPRRRLQQLLERTDLFGRDVLMDIESLQRDCGDLIGFLQDEHDSPIVMQSTDRGYIVWAPTRMGQSVPLQQCLELLDELNPRMVALSPAFQEKDLSTIGLLRFAYGTPKNTSAFVIGGLLLGLVLGFLLSIGRDVGAARWIFGLGITGVLAGTSLGFLSGGFRLGVGVMLLSTLLSLLTPTFNTVITNQALPDRDLNLLIQISVVLVAAGITRVCMEWVQSRAVQLSQQRGAVRSQLASMHRLLRLPTEFFRLRSIGDLQLRFAAIEELRGEIQALLEGGLLRLVLTSLYILFMLRISVKLTALALVVAGLILIPTALIGLQSRPLQRRQEEAEADAQSRNLELIGSVSKLRLAGAEVAAARWWGEKFQRIVSLENALDLKEANASLLQSVMPNLGNLLVYIVITRLIAEAANTPALNAPNIGQLLGFFSAFGTFIGATAGFAGLLIGAFDMPVIYERARPILDATPETQDALEEANRLEGMIHLDRVSYRYAPELPLVLDNVSFQAEAKRFFAIVGPSGSGKSTIVRLLLGFSTPENGEIRFDGQPLNGLRLDSVRRQIGTVLQHNTLFSGSLIEAIAGGSVIDEEMAWHAAELAGLADEIRAMPMGLQTVVTEGGGTLSGGQRQRVAIARALVRQPRILIFDEATSALDNRSQAIVTRSLDELSITRIVIAHRLSTIQNADQILVLSDGQVKEQGSCDSLMNGRGLFYRMMERQIR